MGVSNISGLFSAKSYVDIGYMCMHYGIMWYCEVLRTWVPKDIA